jgi:type IV secretion system protein VirB4
MLLEKLIKQAKQDPAKLVAKKPDEDFLPYVCHFDPNTILTKNGELLQIIRITGFGGSSLEPELSSLREAVRDSITESVKDNKVAFWFNTIRRKKNFTPKGKFGDFFSQKVNEAWVESNKWDDQFVNELYITVIVEGLDSSIVNLNAFARSFSYMTTKSLHHRFLQEAHTKLSQTTSDIILGIEEYGAKLLGINEWDGVLYSEPMRFFGKIINLYEERYPLSANDISNDLGSHKLAFGDRELQVLGYKNKNFAAILSLKEYFEVSTASLDRILQLPFEFIVTQSFDFTFSKKDLEPYEYQNYILQISGDEDFRQTIGLADFIDNNRGLSTDYGKLQTTIMMISRSQEDLEKDVKSALEQFNSLGFAMVREDIFLEHCFWSQLPGNFRYLRRQKLIDTNHLAGFAALHNFPTGIIAGNEWGPAVTVLKTVLNTPYFFNFHDGDLGHTVILGPENSGKTVLLNFLLTQARRFNNKLFYFDLSGTSKCFIKALSGRYRSMSEKVQGGEFLQLNPLSLPKNDENRNFLADFFYSLIFSFGDEIPKSEIEFIPQIIERIFTSNANNFSLAVEIFNSPETQNIYEKLTIWNGEGLSHIFGSEGEISWLEQIIAFDLSEISDQKEMLIPVVNYLLYRIENSLDQSPAIIVLNEAWEFIDNQIIGPKMADFLARMRQKNCMVILTSRNIENVDDSGFTAEIKKNLATEIFMPNAQPHQCYKTIFGLNDEELEIIKMMEIAERHFLFKHDGNSVIATINLAEFIEILKILSADEMTRTAMDEVIAANLNEPPTIWLSQLFEILRALENERLAEEKQKLRAAEAEERRLLKRKLEGEFGSER